MSLPPRWLWISISQPVSNHRWWSCSKEKVSSEKMHSVPFLTTERDFKPFYPPPWWSSARFWVLHFVTTSATNEQFLPGCQKLVWQVLCPCANRHYSSNQAMAPASQKGEDKWICATTNGSIPQVPRVPTGGWRTLRADIKEILRQSRLWCCHSSPSKFVMLSISQLTGSLFPNLERNRKGGGRDSLAPYPTHLEFHVHVSLLEVINSSSCALQQLVSLLVTEPEIHTFPARERSREVFKLLSVLDRHWC